MYRKGHTICICFCWHNLLHGCNRYMLLWHLLPTTSVIHCSTCVPCPESSCMFPSRLVPSMPVTLGPYSHQWNIRRENGSSSNCTAFTSNMTAGTHFVGDVDWRVAKHHPQNSCVHLVQSHVAPLLPTPQPHRTSQCSSHVCISSAIIFDKFILFLVVLSGGTQHLCAFIWIMQKLQHVLHSK